MADIDIEAIKRNAISPGLHSEANSVYWWKTSQALLDAYEAEQARADVQREVIRDLEQEVRRLGAALDVVTSNREHWFESYGVVEDRLRDLQAKLQAISDLHHPGSLSSRMCSECVEPLPCPTLLLINPPAAVPEGTPTDE